MVGMAELKPKMVRYVLNFYGVDLEVKFTINSGKFRNYLWPMKGGTHSAFSRDGSGILFLPDSYREERDRTDSAFNLPGKTTFFCSKKNPEKYFRDLLLVA